MSSQLIKEVTSKFKSIFKTEPIVIFSPGRINIIGEHTDYNGGLYFPQL